MRPLLDVIARIDAQVSYNFYSVLLYERNCVQSCVVYSTQAGNFAPDTWVHVEWQVLSAHAILT
jgi:hypothetical protein